MAGDGKTQNSTVRGVILDYGEVLCHRPVQTDLARMADIFGISPDQFAARYEKNRRAYDRGDLTPEEYWRSFVDNQAKPLNPQDISTLRSWDVEMWSHTNPVMIAWIQAMQRAGMATALLSNMHVDMVAKVRREFSWVGELTFAVFSHELKLAKPEAKIYEYCLKGLGTRAEETLFVDDREINIQAAQALGIAAIRFESVPQLHMELKRLNFPVLPAVSSANPEAPSRSSPRA